MLVLVFLHLVHSESSEGSGTDAQTFVPPRALQRAIRVRSHSMETMVGSQRKLHGGNIPGSLSGGIVHNSMEVTKTTFSVSTVGPEPACGGGGEEYVSLQVWVS